MDGFLLLADTCVSAGIIFVTVWFFFVQSPFLFNRLGREKFVPIMMQIMQLYFKFTVVLNGAVAAISTLRSEGGPLKESQNVAACAALAAVLINLLVVVPRALAAGRRSMRERKGTDNSSSVKDFAIEGGSKTETKTMHQTVVVFVLVDVAALVAHILLL